MLALVLGSLPENVWRVLRMPINLVHMLQTTLASAAIRAVPMLWPAVLMSVNRALLVRLLA